MHRPMILVGTPCFGGMVTQNYMLSVIRLMSHAKSAGFDVSLSMVGYDALISRVRSTLVATFLDNPLATHLLFVDADIRSSACCDLIRILRERSIRSNRWIGISSPNAA